MSEIFVHIFGLLLLLSGLTYAVWIFTLNMGIRRENDTDTDSESLPFVSVIIAFRNEETHLKKLVSQLITQDYPNQKFEIIFVNDHSSDGSKKAIQEVIVRNKDCNLRILELVDGVFGKKNALKKGIECSKGSWIVFTDADCGVNSMWLYELMKHSAGAKCKMILGPVKMHPDNTIQSIFCLDFASLQAVTEGACGIGKPFLSNGANLAFEKVSYEKLQEIDGETYSSGDDVFLLHSFLKVFGNDCVSYAKSKMAIVETAAPKTFEDFFRQRIRWASKAKGYQNLWAGYTALLVLITNMLIFIAGIVSIFSPLLASYLLICLSLRFISEMAIFVRSLPFYSQNKLLIYYPFVLPFYPIYIGVVAIGTLRGSYSWKNRRVS